MASLLAGAGTSAVTGLIGAGKQASAIKKAANIQATAATHAADLSKSATDNSLNFTKDTLNQTRNTFSPYQAAGTGALQQLATGTAPGGVFNSTPTAQQVLAQDPGYGFNLEQGQKALERMNAAGGTLNSGGALKAGVQYASDYANNEYQNAYQRYASTRQQNYNNLATLANYGLSADTTLAGTGTAAAGNVSGTSLTGTNMQTGQLTDAAGAQAAGITGSANAWASGLQNVGNLATLAGLQSSSGYKKGPSPADVAPDSVGYGEGSAASNFQ